MRFARAGFVCFARTIEHSFNRSSVLYAPPAALSREIGEFFLGSVFFRIIEARGAESALGKGGAKRPSGRRALRISVVRGQALSIERSVPSVGIQTPSFPSGFPPPRGIGDSPRIMHDIRGCDTHAYRGALTYFKRRALPVEIPARGEEFGARALCPCLLSVSSALGTQRARRDFQAAASPPVKVWLSGALFRLRKSLVRSQARSE